MAASITVGLRLPRMTLTLSSLGGQTVSQLGLPGAKGAPGDKGEKGDRGDVGPQGLPGPATWRGPYDAGTQYQAVDAVAHDGASYVAGAPTLGVAPPLAPWLLIADKGAVGPAGPPGAQGPAGAQGVAGPSGPAGSTGPTGSQGVQGVPGPAGPKGDRGDPGEAGITTIAPTSPTTLEGLLLGAGGLVTSKKLRSIFDYLGIWVGTTPPPDPVSPAVWASGGGGHWMQIAVDMTGDTWAAMPVLDLGFRPMAPGLALELLAAVADLSARPVVPALGFGFLRTALPVPLSPASPAWSLAQAATTLGASFSPVVSSRVFGVAGSVNAQAPALGVPLTPAAALFALAHTAVAAAAALTPVAPAYLYTPPAGGGAGATYVGAGAVGYVGSGAGPIPLPADIQAGDILVMFGTDPQVGTEPAAWTQKVFGGGATVYWKRAGASESAPLVEGFDGETGYPIVERIYAFRDCVSSGDPFDVTSGIPTVAASGATASGAALTTLAGDFLGMFVSSGGVAATAVGGSADTLDTSAAGGNNISLAYKSAATTAGAQAAPTVTFSASAYKVHWTFALKKQ